MFNLKLGKKVALTALLAFSAASVQAGVLDTFDYDVSLSVNTQGGTVSETYTSVTSTVPAGDVTYTLTNLTDTNDFDGVTVNAAINNGNLYYSESAQVDSNLRLHYFDADALSPLDLSSDSAFYFDVISADLGLTLDLVVSDIFGDSATASYNLNHAVDANTAPTPERLTLSFSSFIGNVDFSSVFSIDAIINSPMNSDLVIAEVGTVPEPTTLAIFGLGLIGFAASRKRKA